jgi:hypothetical protein
MTSARGKKEERQNAHFDAWSSKPAGSSTSSSGGAETSSTAFDAGVDVSLAAVEARSRRSILAEIVSSYEKCSDWALPPASISTGKHRRQVALLRATRLERSLPRRRRTLRSLPPAKKGKETVSFPDPTVKGREDEEKCNRKEEGTKKKRNAQVQHRTSTSTSFSVLVVLPFADESSLSNPLCFALAG